MKNIGLGLVFSLASKFLWALGRGDGISAPPPRGQAELKSWDIGHQASVPTSTPWDLECNSSVSPGAQERQLCNGS